MKAAQYRNDARRATSALAMALLLGLGAVGLTSEANARPGGCVKGAIVGAVAGHFVGHSGLGAAAGCVYGVHERHQYDRQQQTNEGRSSSGPGSAR